jgi:hypothetical protein
MRDELAPIASRLANHPYLAAVETGRVETESLRRFAGEQRAIITSDRASFAHLAERFPEPPAGAFFSTMADGEVEALRLLESFSDAVGLRDEYEPLPGCQAYPAYVAWLALNASPADVALAFLANLESWGRSCARIRDALQPKYGADAVAFFAYFAATPPDFEPRARALVEGGDRRRARRAARLLQAYELLYWDTLADELQ